MVYRSKLRLFRTNKVSKNPIWPLFQKMGRFAIFFRDFGRTWSLRNLKKKCVKSTTSIKKCFIMKNMKKSAGPRNCRYLKRSCPLLKSRSSKLSTRIWSYHRLKNTRYAKRRRPNSRQPTLSTRKRYSNLMTSTFNLISCMNKTLAKSRKSILSRKTWQKSNKRSSH